MRTFPVRGPRDDAATAPPQRLPQDALYELYDHVHHYLERIAEPPVLEIQSQLRH